MADSPAHPKAYPAAANPALPVIPEWKREQRGVLVVSCNDQSPAGLITAN